MQEHWSDLPFTSPIQEIENESVIVQLCPNHSYRMDCSLPGLSILGFFQARVLKWVAIAFSSEGTISFKLTTHF